MDSESPGLVSAVERWVETRRQLTLDARRFREIVLEKRASDTPPARAAYEPKQGMLIARVADRTATRAPTYRAEVAALDQQLRRHVAQVTEGEPDAGAWDDLFELRGLLAGLTDLVEGEVDNLVAIERFLRRYPRWTRTRRASTRLVAALRQTYEADRPILAWPSLVEEALADRPPPRQSS